MRYIIEIPEESIPIEVFYAAPKILEALKDITEHGMVAAPGPHFRWPDEYYELFDKARAIIAEIADE